MKCLAITAIALLCAAAPVAAQSNKANPSAPGQDRVCLVTTGIPIAGMMSTSWTPSGYRAKRLRRRLRRTHRGSGSSTIRRTRLS
jgi:hypothetical protein